MFRLCHRPAVNISFRLDRDDMLGWIRAIRENSRAEGEGGEPGPAPGEAREETRQRGTGSGPLSPAGSSLKLAQAIVPSCVKWASRSIPGDSARQGLM